MKLIDLLNKIANGEEVPKRIKINNVIYEYRGYMYCTEKANYHDIEDYLFGKWNFNILNDEVEIIEEDKEIKKLDINYIDNSLNGKKHCEYKIELLAERLNEIIDEINKLKEK